MYRAELYAILVALEVFRGDLEVFSDCKGVVDEAGRIRNGGRVSPTSRHADLWARYRDALKASTLIFQKSSRKVETLLGGRWPFLKTARKDFRPFERT